MQEIIERLLQSLSTFTTFFNDSAAVFVVAVGVAIGLFALSVMYLINNATSRSRRRIRAAVADNQVSSTSESRQARKIDASVQPVSSLVLPSSDKELADTRKRLNAAGYLHKSSTSVYYFWKLVLALGFGIVALLVTTYFPRLTTVQVVLYTGVAAFVGSLLPSYLLDKWVAERKKRIVNAFPDMLDMLVACSEAGLGLNAALQRVAREIKPSHPDLGGELELVNAEILAGVDRIQALKGLGTRTDIPDIQGFVAMLTQSVRFGTSIAEALRIFAEEFRDKRMQKAEEVAAKIATKLLFPLILCFFPCFFLVAVGPAVITMMKVFAN